MAPSTVSPFHTLPPQQILIPLEVAHNRTNAGLIFKYSATRRRTTITRIGSAVASSGNMNITAFRTGRINHKSSRQPSIVVETPLENVTVHVIGIPGVRLESLYTAWAIHRITRPPSIPPDFIHVLAPVKFGCQILSTIQRRRRPRTAGIFPFGLSRHSDAQMQLADHRRQVRAAVPAIRPRCLYRQFSR